MHRSNIHAIPPNMRVSEPTIKEKRSLAGTVYTLEVPDIWFYTTRFPKLKLIWEIVQVIVLTDRR